MNKGFLFATSNRNIVVKTVCGVTNFEPSSFSYMTKHSLQKLKYLENGENCSDEIKSIFGALSINQITHFFSKVTGRLESL